MSLSKKISCKQTNDSNKRGEYWKFDEFSIQIRDPAIKSYKKKSLLMLLQMVEAAVQASAKNWSTRLLKLHFLLKITRDNINNKMRNIQGLHKQREVSPAFPYHAIGCPTLPTDSDSSISAGLIFERTRAENPLDIVASQAAEMLEPSSRCAVSMQLTLPNRYGRGVEGGGMGGSCLLLITRFSCTLLDTCYVYG